MVYLLLLSGSLEVHNISIFSLLAVLFVLVLVSAFFSGSEIGMMSVNRYRLKHLVKSKNKRAKRVHVLLEKPDRLLGIILIGNTLANIIASAVATVVGQRLYGDSGVAAATAILTFIILIFSEMMPKTLAAIYPEKVAFAVSLLLTLLSRILSPFI
jgi:Mg2+/Co2+ transporter CorB